MGFFEKVKNMFTEEVEEEEVKVEKIKKEQKKVVSENLANKEIEKPVDKLEEDLFTSNEDLSFNKPVFFDDNDFQDLNFSSSRSRITKDDLPPKRETEKSIYNLKEEPEEKKIFKPTPIISPVYGVLDKNYHKEDIVSRSEANDSVDYYEPTVDAIRNKAYGTLEDELENTLFGQNSILLKDDKTSSDENESANVSNDMLSSLTDDISKELDELLVKKEKYTDEEIKKNIKKDDSLDEEDLLGFIDSTLYKDGEAE